MEYKSPIEKKVFDMFKENNLWYETNFFDDDCVEIMVACGDWKHDHRYLTYLMEKIGFTETDEYVTEEDGSDCYSSIHTYKLNN